MSETNTALTPYDTGDRLEPQPWPLRGPSLTALIGINPSGLGPVDPDRYGYVDFDDDEGVTVFTVVGKRRDSGDGYLLSIMAPAEDHAIEVDGDRTLVLNVDTLAGLSALIDMARRGRDDFQYQAENTSDYSEEDVRVADDQWFLAELAIKEIQGARP